VGVKTILSRFGRHNDFSGCYLLVREAVADTHIQQAAIANSLENFKYVFDKALEGKFIDRMDQNQDIFARYMNDPDFAKVVVDLLRKQVYEQIRTDVKRESVHSR
jgi:type I restriction enzyme R subunit